MVLMLGAAACGCGRGVARYVYTAGPDLELQSPEQPLRVAVVPFKDLRGKENSSWRATRLKFFIPLVPYVPSEYERPGIAVGYVSYLTYHFRPTEDLAKSVVAELEANDLFEAVLLSTSGDPPNVDFYLTGEIHDTTYSSKMISYGLSIFGPLLWLAGLPAGTVQNSLSLDLTLSTAADGEAVWSHRINGDWSKLIGPYYNVYAEFDGYPIIMKAGIREGIKDLAAELQNRDVFP